MMKQGINRVAEKIPDIRDKPKFGREGLTGGVNYSTNSGGGTGYSTGGGGGGYSTSTGFNGRTSSNSRYEENQREAAARYQV